ncbi:oxygenase MpaB family protein [Ketobacter alkanivorans]|nr:oxygenase MpaB family protein [Ketobacter alkanivorans]
MNMSVSHHIRHLTRVGDPNRPALKSMRRVFRLLYGSDPHPTPGQMADIKRHMLMGDRLADAVVEMYKDLPVGQGRKLVDQALEHGIDSIDNPPQALIALFEQVDDEPIWLDHDKLRLACDVSRRVGPSGELVLRNLALMGGYLGAAAAKPLVFTGQLDRMTPRRLVETGKFWMDVTTVGGLGRKQEGFKSAVRVRIMHAQVRKMLLDSGKWNMEWGHPLNQWDSMATILEFSSIFLTGLRSIGFIFSKKEREAVIHLWRYIGFLMGVEERILPASEADSMRALYQVVATICDPDEDTKVLGLSLANAPTNIDGDRWWEKQLGQLERTLRVGYTRFILGDKAGDELGLPKTAAKYFWPAQAPLRFGSELVRLSVPGATQLLVKFNERVARQQFPQKVKQTQADTTFTPVSALAR